MQPKLEEDKHPQVFLLTNEGPADFTTTHGTDQNGYYRAGSYVVGELLQEIQEFCVGHVHGHSHLGAFTDSVRHSEFHEFPVVTPGALYLGEYGTMRLQRFEVDKEHPYWHVTEVTKKFLPSAFHIEDGEEWHIDALQDLDELDTDEDDYSYDDIDDIKETYAHEKANAVGGGYHGEKGDPRHYKKGVD